MYSWSGTHGETKNNRRRINPTKYEKYDKSFGWNYGSRRKLIPLLMWQSAADPLAFNNAETDKATTATVKWLSAEEYSAMQVPSPVNLMYLFCL